MIILLYVLGYSAIAGLGMYYLFMGKKFGS